MENCPTHLGSLGEPVDDLPPGGPVPVARVFRLAQDAVRRRGIPGGRGDRRDGQEANQRAELHVSQVLSVRMKIDGSPRNGRGLVHWL